MTVGRNINTTTTVVHSVKTVTGATSVALVAANPDRVKLTIALDCDVTTVCVWIRMAVSGSSTKTGELIFRNMVPNGPIHLPRFVMEETAMDLGPVSAIIDSGTVDIYITEYSA